jgi:hypothetical protein
MVALFWNCSLFESHGYQGVSDESTLLISAVSPKIHWGECCASADVTSHFVIVIQREINGVIRILRHVDEAANALNHTTSVTKLIVECKGQLTCDRCAGITVPSGY